jgi:hypothetical protein
MKSLIETTSRSIHDCYGKFTKLNHLCCSFILLHDIEDTVTAYLIKKYRFYESNHQQYYIYLMHMEDDD